MTTNPPAYHLEGSLADRVQAFFARHPDEELSRGDVALKFDVAAEDVERLLKPLVADHQILYGPNEARRRVYTAGAALRLKPTVESPAKPAAKPRKTGGHLEQVIVSPDEIAALQVDHGVPIAPATSRRLGASKWAPLVAKLKQVGDSVASPTAWRGPVAAYVSKLNSDARKAGQATHYVVRAISADTARIWRKA